MVKGEDRHPPPKRQAADSPAGCLLPLKGGEGLDPHRRSLFQFTGRTPDSGSLEWEGEACMLCALAACLGLLPRGLKPHAYLGSLSSCLAPSCDKWAGVAWEVSCPRNAKTASSSIHPSSLPTGAGRQGRAA